jgi:hypothetical protein
MSRSARENGIPEGDEMNNNHVPYSPPGKWSRNGYRPSRDEISAERARLESSRRAVSAFEAGELAEAEAAYVAATAVRKALRNALRAGERAIAAAGLTADGKAALRLIKKGGSWATMCANQFGVLSSADCRATLGCEWPELLALADE